MRNTIAVMNTKGGVGKSTLVLAMAETLSAQFRKNVLIIDSDSQASVSAMLLTAANLHRLQSDGLTIVDLLVASVLNNVAVDWPRFVVGGVSDVDEARTVYLIPSDMQLTLFEREVSKESLHARLRSSIGALLGHVRSVFDIILIDCPPGLSVLTESWLREADFHFSPTKPDYVSTCGLEVFRRFKGLNPEMGFAENLGVLVNMKDMQSAVDGDYQKYSVEPGSYTRAHFFGKYPELANLVDNLSDEEIRKLQRGGHDPATTAPPARADPRCRARSRTDRSGR